LRLPVRRVCTWYRMPIADWRIYRYGKFFTASIYVLT
jgi:hypothetical protein